MYKENIGNFNFWFPIEKSKTDKNPDTGEVIMKLGGIASTSDEDSDGEFLDPKGFDIQPLIKSGMVNWHHQTKGQPSAIIGEPSKAEIRKDGLYLETILYPSSSIAKDVWELAQTLEKDSKTRRLGYSIEGRVLKRKSNDRNSLDYKKIDKAIITGVAITHQPKNPKTFANIIKGELNNDFQSIEDYDLITLNKIQKDFPSITLNESEKILKLTKKIANMGKRNSVTDEDLNKAYEALGLEIESDNDVEKGGVKKSTKENETSTEKDETEKGETSKESETAKESETEEEVKKGNAFEQIKNVISASHNINSKQNKSLGLIVKATSDKLGLIESSQAELMEIIKSQNETIIGLSERIESFASSTPGPKSVSSSKFAERNFGKGFNDELEKSENENVISISEKPHMVSELLDQATFSKGYDDEFSNATTSFEATHSVSRNVISRLKKEFGITLTD